jgi:GTP-binding protein EngB required for normal cell division
MTNEKDSTDIARDNRQAGSVGDLRSYMRIKLEVADIVTSAMHLASEQKDEEGVLLAQRLLARIAEDRFNLVVVGLFNRGKSSLMNAVLGVDRLPVGVLPLTSVITTVGYGSRERLILQREGWSIPQEKPISAITEYVTETGNPGNQRKVTLAEVQIPSEILRRGFHFIDTPGIGSAILQNTATTEEFLPEADAIIFVTSFEFPFTDAERQFFRKVRRHVRKIFVVANKADLVSEHERNEVLNFLKGCVEKETANGCIKVFALSARDGLAAKVTNRPELMAASGLAEFERSLIEFMTTEKSREFLIRMAERVDGLLQRQKAELHLRRRAYEDPKFAGEHLRELNRSIDDLLKTQSQISGPVSDKIRAELLPKLRPELNAAIRKASDAAASELMSFLSGERQFREATDYLDLEKTVKSTCALTLSEATHEIDKRLESTVRELGGKDLQQLCESPAKVREIGNRLLVLSGAMPVEEGQEGSISPTWPAGFHNPEVNWATPGYLWLYRIPVPSLRRFVLRKCLASLDQALFVYEDAFLKSAVEEACTWLEHLMRDAGIQINSRARRLKDILQGLTKIGELAPLDALMDRIAEIRNALHEWSEGPAGSESGVDQSLSHPVHLEPCIICSKALKALYNFFCKNQYDLVTDQQIRLEHAKVAGFCPLHTWHYAKIASPQGICFAYAPLLSALSKQLEEIRTSHHSAWSSKTSVLQMRPDRDSCPACRIVRGVEETVANKLIGSLSSAGRVQRPLCLPHLALLLGKAPNEAVDSLLQEQAELIERTAEDMRAYSLKHNAIRRALLTEEEQSAAVRGLIYTAGYAGLTAPWDEDR